MPEPMWMWLALRKCALATLRPLPFSVWRWITTSQAANRGVVCAFLVFGGVFGFAAESQETHPTVADKAASGEPFKAVDYGERGLEFRTANGKNLLWLGFRLQMRYDSLPGPLASQTELRSSKPSGLELNRGRIKSGGHVLTDRVELYTEADFASSIWLDYRATWRLNDFLRLRVGQWKSEFNRERVDSSGAQQLAERSLVNYWVTVDRQAGVALSARVGESRPWDSMVWLEYLGGHGRGGGFDEDSGLGLLRWQWNPQGEVLGFGQGDLVRRDTPISSIALATVYGASPYTRFSSSGGGQLPGYRFGDYRLLQVLAETAVHWRGVAWQQEFHWKNIEDRVAGDHRDVLGAYAQIGAFPSEAWSAFPQKLEFVGRVAYVDPEVAVSGNDHWEWTLGANYYLNGHRNKLTADISLLDFDTLVEGAESGVRFRLQWEFSF